MQTEKTQLYFKNLKKEIDKNYAVAEEAKKTGLDPVDSVEVPLAMTMAAKVVGLIATIYPQVSGVGIDKRILELEKKWGKLDPAVCLQIAEEVAKQKFCKFSSVLEAIDAGTRVAFAYITLGVVSSPLEGLTEIKICKTRDGKEYLSPYYSGPVRSAGGTGAAFSLVILDYLREIFGYAKYDPTEDEIKRAVTELKDYHDRITNLQYMPTEEEIIFLAKNCPIQMNGDKSEKVEVSNYKHLERIETNFIRSGYCLVFGEGLAQKAAKIQRYVKALREKGFKLSDWDFLEGYVELHETRSKDVSGAGDDARPTYIKDLVAGRPVYGHPSKSGGFRFRYGRGRTSGFSAASIHPATMAITDDFIAIGTQLKIEKPTKGCVITSCDSIDGPIVKLFNGSVTKLNSVEDARKLYSDVDEIIYLGDILFPFSDLANRNYDLIKPGYVEEWWKLELEEKDKKVVEGLDIFNVDFDRVIRISEKYGVPLHPKYIFYWTEISKEEFKGLIEWLKNSKVCGKIIFPFTQKDQEKFSLGKRCLELLGVEHEVTIENVVLSEESSKTLFVNLGLDLGLLNKEGSLKESIDEKKFFSDLGGKNILEVVNEVSDFIIKDKAGDFIGTRMGRPEKAKLRKLTGSPNVLFPVGNEGGRLRSVNAACEVGKVRSQFPLFYCKQCKKETIYSKCETCNCKTDKMFYCRECDEKKFSKCTEHEFGNSYNYQELDIPYYFASALKKVGVARGDAPDLIKGIRGTSSADHIMEHLSKGVLRAMFNLQVNKDGTIRFDVTELPLTHFKPKEIFVSVEKLKALGYSEDYLGNELVSDNQILELMPHDVVLPSCSESPDERADDVFIKIANFVDEVLVRFYEMKPFYNVKKREDLVGNLGVCMAPHNCAGVICRIIGFSNTQGGFASPYMHAAIRRDCFGYDTYLPIKENGSWKISKIGDLVESLKPEKIVDNWETKEKRVNGFETVGGELKEVKINNFTKHTTRLMFEIKTSLGKKLRVTENHKFLVGGKTKRSSKLKIGDRLPLPRRIDIKSRDIKSINLLESLRDENLMVRGINKILLKLDKEEKRRVLMKLGISLAQFRNYKFRDSYPAKFILGLNKKLLEQIYQKGMIAAKRDNVELPIVIELSNEFLEVIGLYVAEGYSRTVGGKKGLNQVYIASDNEELRLFIEQVIQRCFDLKPSENKKDRVTFSSRILYLFFIKFLGCGHNAKDKRIPGLFLDLKLEKLACILRGYFEGGGSVSRGDKRVTCDSISEGLLYDLEFCLARFGMFAKRYEYEKEPGSRLRNFYNKKRGKIPKFKITELIIGSDFIHNFMRIGFLSKRKKDILNYLDGKSHKGMGINYDEKFVYDPIISINDLGERESYCLNVDSKDHLVVANSIVVSNCDGDEMAFMMLMDVLLNFSMKFLPSHRGGTQDAPLVLNGKIDAGEVDDQILDLEMVDEYPLELYRKAERRLHSSEVEIPVVKSVLKEEKDLFVGTGFTHDTRNFNNGVLCSSYKTLETMKDKVEHQMGLVEKLRSADTIDTARLIIERHFMRDLRGNLRKFSHQTFRCVGCNEIVRRPPLAGVCPKCRGKLIFTINEGGIKKYLEPALDLANKYNLSSYLKQCLELTKRQIDGIFGKELEKQESIEKWF